MPGPGGGAWVPNTTPPTGPAPCGVHWRQMPDCEALSAGRSVKGRTGHATDGLSRRTTERGPCPRLHTSTAEFKALLGHGQRPSGCGAEASCLLQRVHSPS